jgi:hypothetical protein
MTPDFSRPSNNVDGIMPVTLMDWMALFANASLIIGIPITLITFIHQERKERQNEQEEIYDKLMEHYANIQEKLFEYPEIDQHDQPLYDPEADRRQKILYEMLVSLFERAFILLEYETDPAYRRMWNSWLDYIDIWSSRPNFRAALPKMMRGEDPHFTKFMADLTGLDLKP